jgi:acyl dehydratase
MSEKMLTQKIIDISNKKFEYTSPDQISLSMIRYYCLSINEENSIYFDEEIAIAAGYKKIPVPPTFVTETNSFMKGPPGEDGAIAHDWGIKIPGTRYIRGGNEYIFHEPFYVGDTITAKFSVHEISEKKSSKDKNLIFLTNLIQYLDQNNNLKCENYETVIFQEI